jgi:hypothetical protein
MSSLLYLSVRQLRQAADLKEEISALENQLSQLLGSTTTVAPITNEAPKQKRGMSAAGKARISAAAKARWARVKAAKSALKPAATPAKVVVAAKPAKKKFTMSAAAKAKISAAAKARWAKIKAGNKKSH